jgi:hypothetical protein
MAFSKFWREEASELLSEIAPLSSFRHISSTKGNQGILSIWKESRKYNSLQL